MTSTYKLPESDENEYIEALAGVVKEGFENIYGDTIDFQISYTNQKGDREIRNDLDDLDYLTDMDYAIERFHLYSFDEAVHATFEYDAKITGNELNATLVVDERQKENEMAYQIALDQAETLFQSKQATEPDETSIVQALIDPLTS